MLTIANAAGFWGDSLAAPRALLEHSRVKYLTLEYLAELTMSILAQQRIKNPALGYAGDFLTVLTDITPFLTERPELCVVTNAGGMNPLACAQEAAKILAAANLGDLKIGVVSGDDLLPRIAELRREVPFTNLDTGQPLNTLDKQIVAANAYLGARGIVDALASGARIVITGRVADASLTVGPAIHEYGWRWDDWNRLAGASVAGHLIECGAQATGGLSFDWAGLDLANVGYPIVELGEDGNCVLTKPPGTSGAVTTATAAAQLVYEIGDPRAYLTPDVSVDFTTVALEQAGTDRVAVRGATGRAATDSYKVSLAYADGFTSAGQLVVYGPDCVSKARAIAGMIEARVRSAGFHLNDVHVECLGANEAVPGLHAPPRDQREVVLRIGVHGYDRAAVECFTREFAPLITSGPPGIAGYASGRPDVRPRFSYWPTLLPKSLVTPRVQIL
jgi:hypothetical protein